MNVKRTSPCRCLMHMYSLSLVMAQKFGLDLKDFDTLYSCPVEKNHLNFCTHLPGVNQILCAVLNLAVDPEIINGRSSTKLQKVLSKPTN